MEKILVEFLKSILSSISVFLKHTKFNIILLSIICGCLFYKFVNLDIVLSVIVGLSCLLLCNLFYPLFSNCIIIIKEKWYEKQTKNQMLKDETMKSCLLNNMSLDEKKARLLNILKSYNNHLAIVDSEFQCCVIEIFDKLYNSSDMIAVDILLNTNRNLHFLNLHRDSPICMLIEKGVVYCTCDCDDCDGCTCDGKCKLNDWVVPVIEKYIDDLWQLFF